MNRRVYIVHGFEGNPHGNWFDWLCAQVKSTGAQAISLAMPNPDKPSTTAWQFTLDQHIGKPDAHTFLVGHSLGCITLLHFLSRQQPQKIGGLLLAAGFADTLPPLPVLDAYIKAASPDFDILRKIDMPKHCLVSDNDTHVPPELTLDMAAKLKSPVTHIPEGGHLMASDGFTQLPQAWGSAETHVDRINTHSNPGFQTALSASSPHDRSSERQ